MPNSLVPGGLSVQAYVKTLTRHRRGGGTSIPQVCRRASLPKPNGAPRGFQAHVMLGAGGGEVPFWRQVSRPLHFSSGSTVMCPCHAALSSRQASLLASSIFNLGCTQEGSYKVNF